jgi:hypothetical protein
VKGAILVALILILLAAIHFLGPITMELIDAIIDALGAGSEVPPVLA